MTFVSGCYFKLRACRSITRCNWRFFAVIMCALGAIGITGCGPIDDPSLDPPAPGPVVAKMDSPLQVSADRKLLWGDLHIHTSLSSDAFLMGVRTEPDDVYRFARGESIEHGAGFPIRIRRPLDFAAVTDHSEYLGQARLGNLDVPLTRRSLRTLLTEESRLSVMRAWGETMGLMKDSGFKLTLNDVDPLVNGQAWQQIIDAAERHNEPGVFTSFIGWEWSADAGSVSTHLHRNVFYGDSNVPALPFSSLDGPAPTDLWAFLRSELAAGRDVLAIPHNPNLSEGNMLRAYGADGEMLSEQLPADRSVLEPVVEILQIKGSSETHPLLSPLDEFADFELATAIRNQDITLESVRGGYARDALVAGLSVFHSEGFNPLRFGVIGASDSHNASSPNDEANYTGKLPLMDGSAGLRLGEAGLGLGFITPATAWGSGGLAGVWAEDNTRASIFAAIRRRETYATSGPRMALQMFGGWGLAEAEMMAATQIEGAAVVPMGGELPSHAGDDGPVFAVFAAKDPLGANLDRIQIVKGWVDEQGKPQEQVFDAAWSDNRAVDPNTGRLQPVTNTVDVKSASYDNSVGSATLTAYWQDPDFNPARASFYYARILEIPTPRWSTFDAKTLGVEPPEPTSIQERAIGSAIWYRPEMPHTDRM